MGVEMTYIIKRINDKEEIIDLTPVETYESLLYTNSPELFGLANSMTKSQLLHLVSLLTQETNRLNRLFNYSFTKKHLELVQQMHEFKRLAKEQNLELWPELGD
jgi:hypothetical protein